MILVVLRVDHARARLTHHPSPAGHVGALWLDASTWLFPGIMDNPDGTKPYAHGSLSHQLGLWQKAIDVRDEAGQPVRVHAHQFRHTVGTRLISAGCP